MSTFKALRCDFCNGGLIIDDSREFAVCEFCGTKYMASTLRAKIQEIRGTVKVEGAVETTTGNAEKERLIKNAETYLSLNENNEAFNIFKQVKQQFPEDFRGWFGLFRTTLLTINDDNDAFQPYKIDTLNNWFNNAFRLCKNKTKLLHFFDYLMDSHGNELELAKYDSTMHIYDEKLNTKEVHTISAFIAWIIFFADDYASLLCYDRLTKYINNIKKQYTEGLSQHIIGPYIRYSGLGFISNINYDKITNCKFLSNLGYNSTARKNSSEITLKMSGKRLNLVPKACFYGWVFASRGAGIYSDSEFLIEQSQIFSKEDFYRCLNLCQHCGGEFKGSFSKVCSKCGLSKDY